jgi:hypothetical protein
VAVQIMGSRSEPWWKLKPVATEPSAETSVRKLSWMVEGRNPTAT